MCDARRGISVRDGKERDVSVLDGGRGTSVCDGGRGTSVCDGGRGTSVYDGGRETSVCDGGERDVRTCDGRKGGALETRTARKTLE